MRTELLFSSENLLQKQLESLALAHALDSSVKTFLVDFSKRVLAVGMLDTLVLVVRIETDGSGKLVKLITLKLLRLMGEPAERIGVSVVQKVEEISLGIVPKQVINLIATAYRHIKERAGERNIRTV